MDELEFAVDAARFVARRSFTYGTLNACLQFPDEILVESITSGRLLEGLQSFFDLKKDLALGPSCIVGFATPITLEALTTEYEHLFEVTRPQGALCGLYAGVYYGDRLQVMEEHVRFYNFFGLHLPDKIEELPDHLGTELEFLRFLSTQEAWATETNQPTLSFQKAQFDFISRHLLRWIDSLEQSVVKYATLSFYKSLISLLRALLSVEMNRLGFATTTAQDSSRIPSIAIS
jgi:DMSO reductase family type II enzyme chaperone